MKPVLSALTLGVLASLSGCGYLMGDNGFFRDRGSDYQQAEVAPRMTIPADLQTRSIGDLLPVPGQVAAAPSGEDGFETPRPRPMLASADSSVFALQQQNSSRWLLAQLPANEVWPLLARFWSDYRVPMAEQDAALSEFATEWVDFSEAAGNPLVRRMMPLLEDGRRVDDEEQRFRVRLEPGVNAGTSEIKVIHQNRDLGDSDSEWPARSDNASFERGLLAELETYLNQSVSAGGSALVSSIINSGPVENSLEHDGAGNSVLYLNADFNRAWADVGEALARADVLVTDYNRSSGVYYVDLDRTRSEKEEPGFFARWFGGDDDAEQQIADENQLQVRLSAASNRVEVSVDAGIEKAADPARARDLLERIQRGLNEGSNGGALLLPR